MSTTPKTIQIEEGKFYKDRLGNVHGPMFYEDDHNWRRYSSTPIISSPQGGLVYAETGRGNGIHDDDDDGDLVEEVRADGSPLIQKTTNILKTTTRALVL